MFGKLVYDSPAFYLEISFNSKFSYICLIDLWFQSILWLICVDLWKLKWWQNIFLVCLFHAIFQNSPPEMEVKSWKFWPHFYGLLILNNYSAYECRIWVAYNYLISNKHECNNCFIKNAHEISINFVTTCRPEETSN